MPIGLKGHSMVSWQNDAIVLGGERSSGDSSSLYKLSCHNGTFTWEEMQPKMKTARDTFVATLVPDHFVDKRIADCLF